MNLSSILSIFILLTARFSFAQQNIWEPVADPLTGKVFTSIAVDENNNLFVGTLNNFYKSTNDGDSWTSIINGLQGHDVYSIVFNNSGDIFIGTSNGGGIYKSSDLGENWIHLNDTLINFSITKLCINSEGHLFAVIFDHGVYRSSNNGQSWKEINSGLSQYSFQQLYISKEGPTKDYLFLSLGEIYNYNYVFRSSNNGDNWEHMNFFSDTQWITSFVSSSSGDIYLGTQEQWHSGNGGIFKSTDLGQNWIYLRSINVSYLLADHNDFIYAVIGGVIRSLNAGQEWEPFYEGSPSGDGGILAINSAGNLFLTFDFEGIYKTLETTTSMNEDPEVPNDFKLFQNYPNPFNPSTKISYQLPQSEKVIIKVYDLVGKEITTLIDEEKSAGSYEVTFDASELPSGIYFYTLRMGSFLATKKMILLK